MRQLRRWKCARLWMCFFWVHLLSFTVVLDHLLDEVLGLPIGVSAASHGVLLIYGEALGVSIYCGGAAEDQIAHSVSLHHLGHVQIHINTAHTHNQWPARQQSTAHTHSAQGWGKKADSGCYDELNMHNIWEGCGFRIYQLIFKWTHGCALGKHRIRSEQGLIMSAEQRLKVQIWDQITQELLTDLKQVHEGGEVHFVVE